MHTPTLLSIVKQGQAYKVRYASADPYDREYPPHRCLTEAGLVTWLQRYALDSWSLQHVLTTLRTGQMAVVPVVRSAAQATTDFLDSTANAQASAA